MLTISLLQSTSESFPVQLEASDVTPASIFRAPPVRFVLLALGIAAAALALLAGLLVAAGFNASDALEALWRGSFGTRSAFFSGTLVRATPLVLAGLGVAIAFRAGVLNVGAEGQLLVGAAAGAAVGVTLTAAMGGAVVPLALIAAAMAGACWSLVAAVLRERRGVLEVISTLMLNFVALHLVSFLVRGPMQEPERIYPQTITLPDAARLPLIVPGTRLHAGFAIAVLLSAVSWWFLAHTASGFRLRVVGASRRAASSAGRIDVNSTVRGAFVASGALAGLAGGVEVSGVTYALYENISPGYGYTAIAVALLARLSPAWTLVSGVLFGALEAGGSAMQRDAGVPSVMVRVVEASVILLLIAADRLLGGGRAPLGIVAGPGVASPGVAGGRGDAPAAGPASGAPLGASSA